jgi:hypothetical protein
MDRSGAGFDLEIDRAGDLERAMEFALGSERHACRKKNHSEQQAL